MSVEKVVYRLVLLPDQFDSGMQDADDLLQQLHAIGFIGDAVSGSTQIFRAGEHFFDHLSFLGCSPYIRLEPKDPADNNYCHVRVQNSDSPIFYFGQNIRIPACPDCKKPLKSVSDLLKDAGAVSPHDIWACEHCGRNGEMRELNWRKTAAFTRIAIEIWSVHPNEAVPNSFLMGKLDEVTGMNWRYIYC